VVVFGAVGQAKCGLDGCVWLTVVVVPGVGLMVRVEFSLGVVVGAAVVVFGAVVGPNVGSMVALGCVVVPGVGLMVVLGVVAQAVVAAVVSFVVVLGAPTPPHTRAYP